MSNGQLIISRFRIQLRSSSSYIYFDLMRYGWKVKGVIHKDDPLPQQICASCVDKLDFVCDFYDSCHVIQERLWWLIESSKNQRQEIQKQPADYQTNKGDDPTQEGVTLGTEYSKEYSNIIIKEECLPDLNLELYPSNQETQEQPASYQTNKGDDPMQEGVTLGTEYSTEHLNIIIKEECLPDLNLELYSSKNSVSHLESKFTCPKCPNMYKRKESLNEHLLKHEDIKKDFPCDTCGEIFHSRVRMRVHMQRHKSNSVACEICRRYLSSKEALEKHRKTVHFHDYVCDICHKKMKCKRMLRAHIISHLESKFTCPKCPNVYKSKQSLNEHLLKHESIKKNIPCDTCGKIFHSNVRMRVHMRRHKSNSLACEICRRHLSSKEALEKHHKTVHLHDYVCDICHKKLKSKQKLRIHIISHLESKFKCPKCPKVYKSKQYLNDHLLKHEDIKKSDSESKFKCLKCPNVYKRKQNLNEHMLKHEDIKKHPIQQIPQNNLQQNNAQSLQRDNMPRRTDVKPRGRMTAYTYFVKSCHQEHKKKHPKRKIFPQFFSKNCGKRWKTMSDIEKKRFHEMAEKDKKRYDTEMQNYTPPKGKNKDIEKKRFHEMAEKNKKRYDTEMQNHTPKGENKGRGKKRKHIKDHNAPKRSLSAFFWFCNDERGKVKMLNPEYGMGDIAKELGKKWSNADPETISKYVAMAEKDKARYERERRNAYKKKIQNNGAPVVETITISDSEWEEWEDVEDDDE
ncbi:uncharacterized protein [Temnothorax longispinosus]|uniref:uncharacterized protein isoform X2 n=1 Tax=Temnothorax longispinosus TaxID=300112 RepID=UPI003A9A20B6